MTDRVLSVGNCAYDHGQLQRLLSSLPDCEVVAAGTSDDALAAAAGCRLILINRVLDRTGESGIDLLRTIRNAHPEVPVMLISNYADAQQQAERAGALPGFGKSQLGDPALASRLRSVMSPEER